MEYDGTAMVMRGHAIIAKSRSNRSYFERNGKQET